MVLPVLFLHFLLVPIFAKVASLVLHFLAPSFLAHLLFLHLKELRFHVGCAVNEHAAALFLLLLVLTDVLDEGGLSECSFEVPAFVGEHLAKRVVFGRFTTPDQLLVLEFFGLVDLISNLVLRPKLVLGSRLRLNVGPAGLILTTLVPLLLLRLRGVVHIFIVERGHNY